MGWAHPMQKFQDWFTQQWVIVTGRKLDLEQNKWLTGPFGDTNGIGERFIEDLAQKEGLIVQKNTAGSGLIPSFEVLNLNTQEKSKISEEVIRFYEQTVDYHFQFCVHWNAIFKFFGQLVNILFSKRINQLNIPIKNVEEASEIQSDIFTLIAPQTQQIKHTIWFRKFKSTNEVIYSGIYSTCQLPSGKMAVKAVFPLPNGNATVIMHPKIAQDGSFVLESSGQRFGDAGFYFLLQDSKGQHWSRYIRSFRDTLKLSPKNQQLVAKQTLTLWRLKVLEFNYQMKRKVD